MRGYVNRVKKIFAVLVMTMSVVNSLPSMTEAFSNTLYGPGASVQATADNAEVELHCSSGHYGHRTWCR